MKLAITMLLAALCLSSTFGKDEITIAAVQNRLREVELNVLLNEYTTLRSECVKLETLLQIDIYANGNVDPKRKEERERIEHRLSLLMARCEELKNRALELGKNQSPKEK